MQSHEFLFSIPATRAEWSLVSTPVGVALELERLAHCQPFLQQAVLLEQLVHLFLEAHHLALEINVVDLLNQADYLFERVDCTHNFYPSLLVY